MTPEIGEAVDQAVANLRAVGIVIEGGQAHLAHAILRAAMTKAVLNYANELEGAETDSNLD